MMIQMMIHMIPGTLSSSYTIAMSFAFKSQWPPFQHRFSPLPPTPPVSPPYLLSQPPLVSLSIQNSPLKESNITSSQGDHFSIAFYTPFLVEVSQDHSRFLKVLGRQRRCLMDTGFFVAQGISSCLDDGWGWHLACHEFDYLVNTSLNRQASVI